MVKFCPECAYPINDKNAEFCAKCGTILPKTSPFAQPTIGQSDEIQQQTQVPRSSSFVQQPGSPKKKRSTVKWIAIGFGGLILLIVFSVIIAQFVYGIPGSFSKTTGDTVLQIKDKAQIIPYDDLFRNNEKYVGKTVYFRGKILQIVPLFGDNYEFRVATKSNQYLGFIEDIIYVHYEGSRFLEGDIIDLWANVDGLKTYTAVLGNPVSIPELTVLHTELVSKGSDSSSIQPTVISQIYTTQPTYVITTNPTTVNTIPPPPLPSTVVLTNKWGDSNGFNMEKFTTQAPGKVTFKIVKTGQKLSLCGNVPSSQILAGSTFNDITLTPYMADPNGAVFLPAGKYSITMNGCEILFIYVSNA